MVLRPLHLWLWKAVPSEISKGETGYDIRSLGLWQLWHISKISVRELA
jgi:hypothetical protein